MSVYVTTRGGNLFPSVLLQPLGHLSDFEINELRSVWIQERSFKSHCSAMRFVSHGVRTLQEQSLRELCQTSECAAITYDVFLVSQATGAPICSFATPIAGRDGGFMILYFPR